MPIIESHCQTVGIETVLWRCPRCGRRFANRNQSHACGRYQLEDHLVGRDPNVVAAFRALLAAARRNGPVTVLPEKTRIAFQVRMSFAAFTLKNHLLHGHVVLARRRDSPRFTKVWGPSPRNQVHEFRLRGPDDVDEEVADWLCEAYAVGQHTHHEALGAQHMATSYTGSGSRSRTTSPVQSSTSYARRTPWA